MILEPVYFTLMEEVYVERKFLGWGLPAKFFGLVAIFFVDESKIWFFGESIIADNIIIQFF